jgi:hypothetical protein
MFHARWRRLELRTALDALVVDTVVISQYKERDGIELEQRSKPAHQAFRLVMKLNSRCRAEQSIS